MESPTAKDPLVSLTDHYPGCFGCGTGNPSSMNIRGRLDGTSMTADWLPAAYAEGGPGLVHGGYLSAAVDEIQALLASAVAGVPAMTAKMEIKYRSPVLVGRPLVLRAEVTEHKGRMLNIAMTATDETTDTICFEGTGLYLAVRQDLWIENMERQGIDFHALDLSGPDVSSMFSWHIRWLRENYEAHQDPVPVAVAVEFTNVKPSCWTFRVDESSISIDPTPDYEGVVDATIGPMSFSIWQSMLKKRNRLGELLCEAGHPVAGDSNAVDQLFRQLPGGRTENSR